jgi:hypothetical protein
MEQRKRTNKQGRFSIFLVQWKLTLEQWKHILEAKPLGLWRLTLQKWRLILE